MTIIVIARAPKREGDDSALENIQAPPRTNLCQGLYYDTPPLYISGVNLGCN